MNSFKNLKDTFECHNRLFQKLYLNHFLGNILYYIGTPLVLIRTKPTVDKLYKLIYVTFHVITYTSACELHRKVVSLISSMDKFDSKILHIIILL